MKALCQWSVYRLLAIPDLRCLDSKVVYRRAESTFVRIRLVGAYVVVDWRSGWEKWIVNFAFVLYEI